MGKAAKREFIESIARGNPTTFSAPERVAILAKYSPDQDRDDHGRWTSSGSSPDLPGGKIGYDARFQNQRGGGVTATLQTAKDPTTEHRYTRMNDGTWRYSSTSTYGNSYVHSGIGHAMPTGQSGRGIDPRASTELETNYQHESVARSGLNQPQMGPAKAAQKADRGERLTKAEQRALLKYSPDQERDDHGRFGSGSGGDEPRTVNGHTEQQIRDKGGIFVGQHGERFVTTGTLEVMQRQHGTSTYGRSLVQIANDVIAENRGGSLDQGALGRALSHSDGTPDGVMQAYRGTGLDYGRLAAAMDHPAYDGTVDSILEHY